MQLTLEQAMMIYQRAIARSAGAGEGAGWWTEVQGELEAVIEAPTPPAAANIHRLVASGLDGCGRHADARCWPHSPARRKRARQVKEN